jgi:hypothetical protein
MKIAQCRFNPFDNRKYTYLVDDDLELAAGDHAVVQAKDKFTVVEVLSVVEADVSELNPKIEYKWVVHRVDMERAKELADRPQPH